MIESLDRKSVNKVEIMRFWRANPCQAAKDIFDVDLDPHQRIVLNARFTHDRVIDVLSRGTGKTFMGGLFGSLRGILMPGHRVGLIGPSFRQSKYLFAEIEKLHERSPIFQASCAKPPTQRPESCIVKFKAAPGKNASFIEALPLGSDGSKIRGARYFDVVADEAAQIDNTILNTVVQGFLATSSDPMERVRMLAEQRAMIAEGLMTEEDLVRPVNNKLILSSTAYYQYNHLWGRVNNLIEHFQREARKASQGKAAETLQMRGGSLNEGQIPHRFFSDGKRCLTAFSYRDPSEGFMNVQSILEARRDMTDYEFRMEYEAYFPPDSEGFFRRSVLDAARNHHEFSPVLTPRKGMLYTLGADPARTGDNFAVAIYEIDLDAKAINLVRIMTWHKINFPEMHINIRRLLRHYGIDYFKMDAGGGGTTIRDLLANPSTCPPGESLILEQDFDEHRNLLGERKLGKLCQFSSYQWVHDANHNLLSALQHGRLRIASMPPVPGEIITPAKEAANDEIEAALTECSSIIVKPVGGRMRCDTPTKHQRKDRYSAMLVGFDAAQFILNSHNRPQTLAVGGFA